MSFYCFNDAGAVASVREINQNPRFYLQNFAPECATNPASGPGDQNGWRCGSDGPVRCARTLANGWDSFKPQKRYRGSEPLCPVGNALCAEPATRRILHPLFQPPARTPVQARSVRSKPAMRGRTEGRRPKQSHPRQRRTGATHRICSIPRHAI